MKAAASTALALAIAFALGDARAGTPINEHRDVSPTAQIDVSNVKGSVTVSGWDKPEVSITGTLGDGAKKLSVEGSADHLRIKVEPPDRQGWFSWGADTRMSDSVLDVRVPKNAEMKIEVVSADVTLSGVAGRRLDVDGVSGKLRLESSAKEIEIDSVSGDIDITGNAERAHVETVSGNIRARGLGGQVKFDTVSGDLQHRAVRYWSMRTRRVSYVLGKWLGLWATVSGITLFMHLIVWVVCVARGEASFGSALGWGLRLWVVTLPMSAAWCALASMISSFFKTPIVSLLVMFAAAFALWLIWIIGTVIPSEPLTYVYPNHFDAFLLHPRADKFVTGLAACLGMTALYLTVSSYFFQKRDL